MSNPCEEVPEADLSEGCPTFDGCTIEPCTHGFICCCRTCREMISQDLTFTDYIRADLANNRQETRQRSILYQNPHRDFTITNSTNTSFYNHPTQNETYYSIDYRAQSYTLNAISTNFSITNATLTANDRSIPINEPTVYLVEQRMQEDLPDEDF